MATKVLTVKLSKKDLTDFDRLHGVCARWVGGWVKVAKALEEIRDRELYRGTFLSFEEYVKSTFGFGKRRSDQLVQASRVLELIRKHDPEAAAAVEHRPALVDAVATLPLKTAIKTIKTAEGKKPRGKVLTVKQVKRAANGGKVRATEALVKVSNILGSMIDADLKWTASDDDRLDVIITLAKQLKGKVS
jgi:hypothetical protein